MKTGGILLLLLPIFYFMIGIIATSTCPQFENGECGIGYSISASLNTLIATISLGVVAALSLISGAVLYTINEREKNTKAAQRVSTKK